MASYSPTVQYSTVYTVLLTVVLLYHTVYTVALLYVCKPYSFPTFTRFYLSQAPGGVASLFPVRSRAYR